MKKTGIWKGLLIFAGLSFAITASAVQRDYLWPSGKMPHDQSHLIAAMLDVAQDPSFNPDKNRRPFLEWYDAPANPNGGCAILISGGGYYTLCDIGLVEGWAKQLTANGFQCVKLVYRSPRPVGIPFYQTAWEDGQRAVRLVRSQCKAKGLNPENIGTVSMSAGSHLALLLGTSALTPAYERVDKKDDIPCHINWAIVNAPAYITTDSGEGEPASRDGYGPEVGLREELKFDAKTCPMSLHHGGEDIYSPNGSTLVYRQLRRMKVPAELHLYADKPHGAFGFDRGIEFLRQMGFAGELAPEEALLDRFASDADRASYSKEDVWPEGKTPDFREGQCVPYLEWHIPKVLKTKAIQIVYSGGGYVGNGPESFEVTPTRRYLNALGMTVVTVKYRVPRPKGLPKHITAWQDIQRVVRIVRSKAPSMGLDPDRIGIMGCSAGGHLTLMGVTSSRHRSYFPIDDLDRIPCNVQWGIGIYPAYGLTDGLENTNSGGGNADDAILAPEFSFDLDTAPMLFIHGDADGWAAMNSVKAWEKMRSMGIQCDLHTLALREHCFQRNASPGTGSYTFLDRIWEFLTAKGFVSADE